MPPTMSPISGSFLDTLGFEIGFNRVGSKPAQFEGEQRLRCTINRAAFLFGPAAMIGGTVWHVVAGNCLII